jgi:hypothetical protein
MPKQYLKGKSFIFLMLLFFFSQFFFYSSNAPATDRVIYVTPGSDAYVNGQAWKNAASTLYWDTETTGTKTVSLGNGEYRWLEIGNQGLKFPGIRHVATDSTTHFSLGNSDDDATTKGVISYGAISPVSEVYCENIIFRPHSDAFNGDMVNMLEPNVQFKNCFFTGNEIGGNWYSNGIANSAGQAIPGEDILTLDGCKFIKFGTGIHTFSKVKIGNTRINGKVGIYCCAEVLDAMGDGNVIDLSGSVPGIRNFLQLEDPAPTAPGAGDTLPEDKTTSETIISEFWVKTRLIGPDGNTITTLEEAFQYFRDWRQNPGGSVSNKINKEYNPFPSDVHVYLDTGESRTSTKLWQGYE